MADIFLSYAREDHALARRLVKKLTKRGWSVWWDEEIPSGVPFDELIENKLREVRCVVVLWSQHSVRSQWVRAEASIGLRREMLISLRIEPDVELPILFTNISTIDFQFGGKLRQLNGFSRTLRDIETIVHPSSTGAQIPTEPRRSRLLYLTSLFTGIVVMGLATLAVWTDLYRSSPSLLLRPPPVALTDLEEGGSIEVWVGQGGDRKKLAEDHCGCRGSFLLGEPQTISSDLQEQWRLELSALQTFPENSSQFSQTLLDWEHLHPLQPRIPGFKLTSGVHIEILVKSRPGKIVAHAEKVIGRETLIDILLIGV